MTQSVKKRVFSGVQPSGNLTIGNYIGALRQWVAEQDTYECFFCVVDLHSLTVAQDPKQLRAKTREVAALYIAAGIDPEKATIFIQSHVPAHSELSWLLSCMTPLGWLYRMTQFKDKSGKQQQESVGAGLLNYPTLMAADILLYQTHGVPVGDDQKQHLEYTRDLAQRFNHVYGETFLLPDIILPKSGARIMGLDNPNAKMSKSEGAEGHAIYLLDELNLVKKKFMRAVTDSGREIKFSDSPEKAGVNNLLTIYQAVTAQSQDEIETYFEGKGYGDLKKTVGEAVMEFLKPLQTRYHELADEGGYLDEVLARGAEKANDVASITLSRVREKIGLIAPNRP
jgi:tryptophanyl-tRNA synthetase